MIFFDILWSFSFRKKTSVVNQFVNKSSHLKIEDVLQQQSKQQGTPNAFSCGTVAHAQLHSFYGKKFQFPKDRFINNSNDFFKLLIRIEPTQ